MSTVHPALAKPWWSRRRKLSMKHQMMKKISQKDPGEHQERPEQAQERPCVGEHRNTPYGSIDVTALLPKNGLPLEPTVARPPGRVQAYTLGLWCCTPWQ